MSSNAKPQGNTEGALTLRDVALQARAWADEVEGLDDETEREKSLLATAADALTGAEKVDRFVYFLKRAEFEAQWAKAEAERYASRRRAFEGIVESLKRYAHESMKAASVPRLEGVERTIWLQPTGKPAVVITDEAAIPATCKYATVTMRNSDWLELASSLWPELSSDDRDKQLASLIKKREIEVSRTLVREAFDRGEDVPGADLSLDNVSVRTK